MQTTALRQINRELAQQNALVSQQLDELMQEVMSNVDICERSDWEEIQKTMTVMIQCAEHDLSPEPAPNYPTNCQPKSKTPNQKI